MAGQAATHAPPLSCSTHSNAFPCPRRCGAADVAESIGRELLVYGRRIPKVKPLTARCTQTRKAAACI